MNMLRVCVKASDGWHYAVPNKRWPDGKNNIKTACGFYVVLPLGCDRHYATCGACVDALKAKAS